MIALSFTVTQLFPMSVINFLNLGSIPWLGLAGVVVIEAECFKCSGPMAKIIDANGVLLRWLRFVLQAQLLVLLATHARRLLLLLHMLPLRRLSRLLLLRLLRQLLPMQLGLSSTLKVGDDASTTEGLLPGELLVKVNHL